MTLDRPEKTCQLQILTYFTAATVPKEKRLVTLIPGDTRGYSRRSGKAWKYRIKKQGGATKINIIKLSVQGVGSSIIEVMKRIPK